MELKIKKLHPEAKIPFYATEGAAGMDLTAISKTEVFHERFGHHLYTEYDTGLSMEVPNGFVGLLFSRSSISNYSLSLANAVGVLDSDYRGPIKFRFKKIGNGGVEYTVGERIGQLVLMQVPKVIVTEVHDLSDTTRGTGGYGSSGK
jgi:dUTP pyrophosphatase